VYCPGLAACLVTQDAVKNGLASVKVNGELHKCTKVAKQNLMAGESFLMQGLGE